MADNSKTKATAAGKGCLSMPAYEKEAFVFVVNGVCYFNLADAILAKRTGGNPMPQIFKVSRDGKDKFTTEEVK